MSLSVIFDHDDDLVNYDQTIRYFDHNHYGHHDQNSGHGQNRATMMEILKVFPFCLFAFAFHYIHICISGIGSALYSLYQAIYSNIHVCISGICSTDEIEWNRNGDGVIDFYPLHFLFPASE